MDDIKLTPEEATARLRRGGFVLCMDVPAEREIGCDCVMWQGHYPILLQIALSEDFVSGMPNSIPCGGGRVWSQREHLKP